MGKESIHFHHGKPFLQPSRTPAHKLYSYIFFGSSLWMTSVSAALESLEGKKRVIELLSTLVPSDVINVFLAR